MLYILFFILFLDLLSINMEFELHENMNDFLSSNIDGCNNPYTMNLSESNYFSAVNADTPSDGSSDKSDMLNYVSDSTLDVTSNEKIKIY